VHVDGSRPTGKLEPPDEVEQALARQHDVGMCEQRREQVELLAGQLDGNAGDGRLVGVATHDDVAERELGLVEPRLGPAQDGLHAREQLAWREGLRDVVVRAEVVMNEAGVLHDYRVDRGKIRALAPGSLTLLEKDGTLVTVPVAAGATIRFEGMSVPFGRLRRGLVATTVRDGSAPATTVEATRR